MSNFPLYTSLSSDLSNKKLTVAQKAEMIRRIPKMDQETHGLIFALIKSYYLEHEKVDNFSIPYNGELSKNSIDFDLQKFPVPLQQLLYKFFTLHRKKIKEDKEIHNLQSTE